MTKDPMGRGALWLKRHLDTKQAVHADEVEFRALKEGASSLSEALRDDDLVGMLTEEHDIQPADRWHRESEMADDEISPAYEELSRRSKLLGTAWPFVMEGSTLRFRGHSPSLVYELCLSISRARSITEKPYNRLPVDFEKVSLVMLLEWLGANAEGIRTGWPREKGLPTRCKELFNHIQAQAKSPNEWRWDPDSYLPADPDPTNLKEAKLDLLAWLKMPTSHGHVYFAGQCACGSMKGIEDKARELTHSGITKWVKPSSWIPFIRCFFVPHILVEAQLYGIIQEGNGNATFDRARLALIAAALPAARAKELRKKLQPAVDLVVSK